MRRLSWWPSLSVRLLASFVFVLWGTILFTTYTLHQTLTQELARFELQALERNAAGLALNLEQTYVQTGHLSARMLAEPPQMALRLYDAQGKMLEASSPSAPHLDLVKDALAGHPTPPEIVDNQDGTPYGYHVVPLVAAGQIVGALEVSDQMPPIERLLQSVRSEFIMAALIGAGSILAVGLYLTGYLKRTLSEIKEQTEAIVSGDFDHRIVVRTRDEMGQIGMYLNRMADELQQVAQTRNEFLSKVSHELRTPLTIAKGFSSLLRQGEMLPAQERTVSIIDAQIDDLTRLVNDLLDLSRRQHSSLDLQMDNIDCGALLGEVLEQQRPLVRSQKVALEANYRIRQVPIRGDRQRLQQVLSNLIGNASRYSRERIVLELDADPDHAIIRVSDDGPGIALEDQARIFEPFFQARKGPRGKAGLGLTVARELVLGHGGDLTMFSQSGTGTTFTITLPRTDAQVSKPSAWRRLIALPPRVLRPLRRSVLTEVTNEKG